MLTRVQCYSGLQAQNWTLVNDNSITNSGFCMDLPDGDKSNGNVVQEWQVSSYQAVSNGLSADAICSATATTTTRSGP